ARRQRHAQERVLKAPPPESSQRGRRLLPRARQRSAVWTGFGRRRACGSPKATKEAERKRQEEREVGTCAPVGLRCCYTV
ncbi:unnamed protein product, partial [Urochloa humidicola]